MIPPSRLIRCNDIRRTRHHLNIYGGIRFAGAALRLCLTALSGERFSAAVRIRRTAVFANTPTASPAYNNVLSVMTQ